MQPTPQGVGSIFRMCTSPKAAKETEAQALPSSKHYAPAALYDNLIATRPEIERKGDANPYTSLNGNMFTLLHQGKLAIRLSEDEREKFLKKYKTNLFEAYGTVMKEYVA